MNKFKLLASFGAAALVLSACEPLPEFRNGEPVPSATAVTTNFNSGSSSVVNAVTNAVTDTAANAVVNAAAGAIGLNTTMQTPPFSIGNVVNSVAAAVNPAPAIATNVTIPAALSQQVAAVTGGFDATPMAIHANVAGSQMVSGGAGQLAYNGINGVRPFLVNTGSVWSGPNTYMLPLGTGNYAHQHLETVSAPVVHSAVTHNPEPITYTEYASTTYSEPAPIVYDSTPAYVAPAYTPAPTPIVEERTATAKANIFMRKSPSFGSEKCNVLPKGHTAKLHYCEGRWCKVTHDGVTGWSSKRHLRM